MPNYYEEFYDLLLKEDRYACIKYVENLLKDKKISIVDLYEKVLGRALVNVGSMVIDEEIRIWQEHVYASIVRSVVENTYTYVVEEAVVIESPKKIIVVCPQDEYHEIGARMVSDFFMLLGHKVTYVGGNTPKEDVVVSINTIKPDIIAISVSNNYNSVAAKEMIELIKSIDENIKIVVGGQVFSSNPTLYKKVGADFQLSSFEDIKELDVKNYAIV